MAPLGVSNYYYFKNVSAHFLDTKDELCGEVKIWGCDVLFNIVHPTDMLYITESCIVTNRYLVGFHELLTKTFKYQDRLIEMEDDFQGRIGFGIRPIMTNT